MVDQYNQKMEQFLKQSDITCKIVYGGVGRNENWKEKASRNWYDVTITSPKGQMSYVFWDSIKNTEDSQMTPELYANKEYHCSLGDLSVKDQIEIQKNVRKIKDEAIPNEYDVIGCLTLYDPESFETFCDEYGYDTDSRSAERIYLAVVKEYHDVKSVFTDEQIEILADIDNFDLENDCDAEKDFDEFVR